MKRGLLFFVIIFLLIGFAQAQFNQPGMDSVIRNSAPYRGWFRVFNEYKQDSAFQAAMQKNAALKAQFDSAKLYYGKLQNKQFELSSLFVANYGLLFVVLNNVKSLSAVAAFDVVGTTSLIYGMTQAKFLTLYYAKFLRHTQAFIKIGGYHVDQTKWRVNYFDYTNYKKFKRRNDRISRRLSQKGKLLYLLN